MEKSTTTSILDALANQLGSYTMLCSSGEINDGQYFVNDFVGYPSIPIIGQYGRYGYNINDVKLLSIHLCKCNGDRQRVIAIATGEEINIPKSVSKVLFNIPELIPLNTPIVGDDESYSRGEFDGIEFKQEYVNNKFPQATSINFAWAVGFQDSEIKKPKNQPMFMNLVLHSFIYPVIDLKGKKRICCDVPTCIFEGSEKCGVSKWENDFRSASFNELRGEFLSVHLRGGASLCFSPNNLKFQMDIEAPIAHFYSLALTENGMYQLTYHWNVNDPKLFKPLDKIFQQSKTTRQVLEQLIQILPKDSSALQTVIELFPNTVQKVVVQNEQKNEVEVSENMEKEEYFKEKIVIVNEKLEKTVEITNTNVLAVDEQLKKEQKEDEKENNQI